MSERTDDDLLRAAYVCAGSPSSWLLFRRNAYVLAELYARERSAGATGPLDAHELMATAQARIDALPPILSVPAADGDLGR